MENLIKAELYLPSLYDMLKSKYELGAHMTDEEAHLYQMCILVEQACGRAIEARGQYMEAPYAT